MKPMAGLAQWNCGNVNIVAATGFIMQWNTNLSPVQAAILWDSLRQQSLRLYPQVTPFRI
jgi:hypothetical protein